MTGPSHVSGIVNHSGSMNVTGSAVGDRPVLNVTSPSLGRSPEGPQAPSGADIGIITILPVEMHALRAALHLQGAPDGALWFSTGMVPTSVGPLSVVAVQTLKQGQRSAMAAYENLRRRHDPKVILLAGIGGGLHRDVQVGDVVLATQVVYYDLRKETPQGTLRRGEELEAPARIGHAVNAFLSDRHPAEIPVTDPAGTTRAVRVHHGPIGSGEAVIADRDSTTVAYLAAFNDKILAVDMEAGGLSLACHEGAVSPGRPHGWLVVRGISDTAGADKNDDHHRIASLHAAMALKHLLPYLRVDED
ncbi:hypothetical protein ACQEU3_25250 [Spirillospora sp. CA-253888]